MIGTIITLIELPPAPLTLGILARVAVYTFVLGLPYIKMVEYIEWRLEQKVPWLKYPARRLLLTLVIEILLIAILLIITNFIIVIIIQDRNISDLFRETSRAIIYATAFIVGGIIIMSTINFFRSWRQSAINEEILKREKLLMEYEALKNQVNPHFFFNSLTALISLVDSDTEKARHFIQQFSGVYRYMLEHHQQQTVDLETEKKFLESIIFLYKIRMGHDLQVDMELDGRKDRFVVPMALQMLFENAIKHNSADQDNPLYIEIRQEDDFILVRNSLNPKTTVSGSGRLGLRNIQSQYRFLSDREVTINKTESHFEVKIPLLNIRHD
jgi:two-component system LytT family sensor kinase